MGHEAYGIVQELMKTAGTGQNGRSLRTRIMLKFGFNPETVKPEEVPEHMSGALRQFAQEYTIPK